MVRALRTGNYSVVIGWLPEDLSQEEHLRLTEAAEEGNAMGFIMRPVRGDSYRRGQHPGLKFTQMCTIESFKVFTEFFDRSMQKVQRAKTAARLV